MKTIFITIFQGVEAKNILRTDIYKNLVKQPAVRIVFFVGTLERAAYYQKEFSNPNVIYESVSAPVLRGWDKFFSGLKFFLLRTETVDLRRKMALETGISYPRYWINWALNRLLARRFFRKVARALDYFLVKDRTFSGYFEKYKPSVVFLAHLFDDLEAHLLREAMHRDVPTIGFINSWDKLTARNSLRLLPDKLIVFNHLVEEEAICHADMAREDICVTGIPQYDWHINYKPVSRDVFLSKKGLDLNKKLIVYAPMGKAFSNSDWDIIDLVSSATESGEIRNAQLL
ncbi:MAG: hypothetical protein AAB885_03215, partial [Patescibacteria group bacterium]